MRVRWMVLAVASSVLAFPYAANAQARLTISDVLTRARERAPEVVSARLALDEAKARVLGASIRSTSNPELDFNLGNRDGQTSRSTDLDIGFGQAFDPRGSRSARLAGANAAVERSQASLDDTIRTAQRQAARAFYDVLYARDRIALLTAGERLATTTLQIAERRFSAGDIAALDVNLAKLSLARAKADRHSAESDEIAAAGQLRVLLGIDTAVAADGRLDLPAVADRSQLIDLAGRRPEIRELEAAIREAEADTALGRAASRPTYGIQFRYQQEDVDRIVMGGVRISLPIFSKGQELRATGTARAIRLRSDLTNARTKITTELDRAFIEFERRRAAAVSLQTDVLASLDDTDTLATRSFEAGQINLADLLIARREVLDTRFQYVTALVEAALARVELDAIAAVIR